MNLWAKIYVVTILLTQAPKVRLHYSRSAKLRIMFEWKYAVMNGDFILHSLSK